MSIVSRRGSPLPATLNERLGRACAQFGDRLVMRTIGLSPAAFWRARGGGAILTGTQLQIEHGLNALETQPISA